MKKYFDLISICAFFLLVGIFFYPTLLKGKLPVPSDSLVGLYHPWRDLLASEYPRGLPFKNFLITDPVRQQIPWRKVIVDQIKSGKNPLWNPFNFAGTPLSANIQAAAFYPLNFLFFIFSFPLAWTLLIILEPILGGFFLYLYLRTLKMSPAVALFGSLIWSFSGFNISWMTWGTITQTALWLPAMLFAVEKIFASKKISSFLIWAFFLIASATLTFFAGHAQVALYSFVLVFVYALLKIISKSQIKQIVVLGLCLLFIVLITSVQWLPLVKLLSLSGRIAESDYLKVGWFLPWQNLAQFVAPDFFGNPATLNYWGVWNYGEFIGYLGITSLIFVFYALLAKRKSQVIFWLIVSVASLVLMLPSPVSYLPFVLNLPLISSLQPTRLMIILDFSLVMLSVNGLSVWLEEKEKNRALSYALGTIFFFLAGLWVFTLEAKFFTRSSEILTNLLVSRNNLILPTAIFLLSTLILSAGVVLKKINRKILILLLLAVTVFDLFRFGWKFTPFTEQKYFFPETAAIKFLKSQSEPFRIMSTDKEILPPNTASFFGIESAEGYDPIFSERFEEFAAASERGKPNISAPFGFNRIITFKNLNSPILPILNVKYVLSLSDLNIPFLKKVFQEGETRIYENGRSLPRAFLVNEVKNATDRQQIINDIFNPSLDLKHTAIAENSPVLESSDLSGSVIIDDYSGDGMKLTVKTNSLKFLVIGNSYNDCWKAALDGLKTPIYRTDYMMMGLFVPSGSHTVDVKCESLGI